MPEIDFTSAAWLQVAQWATSRIESLRKKNDGELDIAQTALVRGQLKAFKELIALPDSAARSRSASSVD